MGIPMRGSGRLKLLYLPLAGLLFAWGFVAGTRQIFPFSELRQIHKALVGPAGAPATDSDIDGLSTATADVVMVGDSNVARGRWAEYFPGTRVINRGISGDTVSGVRARVPEILSRHPRKIFILVGINDVLAGRGNGEILSDYDNVISDFSARGVRVYSQAVFCGFGCPARYRVQIADFNRGLAALVHQRGGVFIDPHFADSAFTPDGIHLTGENYRIWIATLRPLIEGQDWLSAPA